ncbi:MAG: hypothetical protein K2G18_06820 [Bacteroidales bacterium]|nr:hypothetical protein [Bacteroidales bacterium]
MKKRDVWILLVGIIFNSCSGVTNADKCLDAAASQMRSDPALALNILETMNRDRLNTSRLRARHSLLYSMALDKNYVDLKTDSIIAPAVKYYSHYGAATDKLLAYYYEGIIFVNAGDYESAMSSFVKAERYADRCRDKGAVGRLYSAKMAVYQFVYDDFSALVQGELAAEHFLSANDTACYLNEMINLATLSGVMHDYDKEKKYLSNIRSYWDYLSDGHKSRYYSIMLYLSQDVDDIHTEDVISEYLSSLPDSSVIKWKSVSEAFWAVGDSEKALDALESYLQYGGEKSDSYYVVASKVYDAIGDVVMALDAYKHYFAIVDRSNAEILESETRFIEERSNAEYRSLRHKMLIIILALSLTIIGLISFILIQRIKRVKKEKEAESLRYKIERNRIEEEKVQAEEAYISLKEVKAKDDLEHLRLVQENEHMERMIDSLKKEMERLKKIRRNRSFDKETIDIIEKRLGILHKVILAERFDSFKEMAHQQVQDLVRDRDDFMSSTRKTFMLSHSSFIAYLESHGLTEWEIGCCCLYCIGFNGSEVSDFLERKAIYNVNSTIRSKLGIPKRQMKIDFFLKQKMRELD